MYAANEVRPVKTLPLHDISKELVLDLLRGPMICQVVKIIPQEWLK